MQQGGGGNLAKVFLEGLKSGNLYAGAMSPLAGAMVHNATLFFVNGATRDFLYNPKELHPIRDAFIAGATVGAIASVVESPVDLLKCKLQATKEYPGVFSALRSLYSRFGLPGLWQGMGATTLRNVPCFSMYFGFNSISKEFFTRQNNGASLKLYQMFLGGAAAGLGFWGFLYPLDVIKSRMQVQSSIKSERKYRNVLHCVRTMYAEEGARVFWMGYSPALLRALVVNGSIFLAFEITKQYMSDRT